MFIEKVLNDYVTPYGGKHSFNQRTEIVIIFYNKLRANSHKLTAKSK